MDVTFFYGTKRIMTSAFDKNGERILGSPAGDKVTEQVLENGQQYFSDNVSIDGTIYYGYYVPVYQNGDTPVGMVFAGVNKQETLSSVSKIINGVIAMVIVVMLICIATVGVLANTISKALKKSVSSVTEVSQGKLNVQIDNKLTSREDEVGELSRAITVLQHDWKYQ
jgi:methyl-accepting chemotaxis protein